MPTGYGDVDKAALLTKEEREQSVVITNPALPDNPMIFNARRLILNTDGTVHEIHVTKSVWLGTCWEGSAVRRGDPVVNTDGDLLGVVSKEVYCVARNGRIVAGRGGDRVTWHFVKATRAF